MWEQSNLGGRTRNQNCETVHILDFIFHICVLYFGFYISQSYSMFWILYFLFHICILNFIFVFHILDFMFHISILNLKSWAS